VAAPVVEEAPAAGDMTQAMPSLSDMLDDDTTGDFAGMSVAPAPVAVAPSSAVSEVTQAMPSLSDMLDDDDTTAPVTVGVVSAPPQTPLNQAYNAMFGSSAKKPFSFEPSANSPVAVVPPPQEKVATPDQPVAMAKVGGETPPTPAVRPSRRNRRSGWNHGDVTTSGLTMDVTSLADLPGEASIELEKELMKEMEAGAVEPQEGAGTSEIEGFQEFPEDSDAAGLTGSFTGKSFPGPTAHDLELLSSPEEDAEGSERVRPMLEPGVAVQVSFTPLSKPEAAREAASLEAEAAAPASAGKSALSFRLNLPELPDDATGEISFDFTTTATPSQFAAGAVPISSARRNQTGTLNSLNLSPMSGVGSPGEVPGEVEPAESLKRSHHQLSSPLAESGESDADEHRSRLPGLILGRKSLASALLPADFMSEDDSAEEEGMVGRFAHLEALTQTLQSPSMAVPSQTADQLETNQDRASKLRRVSLSAILAAEQQGVQYSPAPQQQGDEQPPSQQADAGEIARDLDVPTGEHLPFLRRISLASIVGDAEYCIGSPAPSRSVSMSPAVGRSPAGKASAALPLAILRTYDHLPLDKRTSLATFMEATGPLELRVVLPRFPTIRMAAVVSEVASSVKLHYQSTLEQQLLEWGIQALCENIVAVKAETNQLEANIDQARPGILAAYDPELSDEADLEELEAVLTEMRRVSSSQASSSMVAWWTKHQAQVSRGLQLLEADLKGDQARLGHCREKLGKAKEAAASKLQQLEYRCLEPGYNFHATDNMRPEELAATIKERQASASVLEEQLTTAEATAEEISTEVYVAIEAHKAVEAEVRSLEAEVASQKLQGEASLSKQELCALMQTAGSWHVTMDSSVLCMEFGGALTVRGVVSTTPAEGEAKEVTTVSDLRYEVASTVTPMAAKLLSEAGVESLLAGTHRIQLMPQILNQIAARVGRVQSLGRELETLRSSFGVEEDPESSTATVWQFCHGDAEFGLRFTLGWGYPHGKLACEAVALSGEVDPGWIQGLAREQTAQKGLDRISRICTQIKGMGMYKKTHVKDALAAYMAA